MARKEPKFPRPTGEKNIIQTGELSFRVRLMKAGHKIDKTFDTLADAVVYRAKVRSASALDDEESSIFEARARQTARKSYTFADLLKDYRSKVAEKKRGYMDSERHRLNKIERCELTSKPLYMFRRDAVIELLSWIKTSGSAAKGVKIKPTSEATQRRYWDLVHHMFEVAVEWHKIDKNPCDELARHEVPKPGKPRTRRLIGEEYTNMIGKLNGEAKAVFILSVETAMRRGEIMAMQWPHFDKKRRALTIPESKTDESRVIPLSSTAVAAITALMKKDDSGKVIKLQRGKIFTLGIDALRYRWRKAREAIESPDLRIHDMRHEAASRLIGDKGLNLIEAAGITGHKNLEMLKRYTHLHHADILKKLG